MSRILVTGGAGFIGSNFIRYIMKKYPGDTVINVDKLTYSGNLDNLDGIEESGRYRFIHADICDSEKMDSIFTEFQFDYVVNFAAETHVDRSIIEPQIFIQTNALGTQVLLDICRGHWMNNASGTKQHCKYIQISTDEVYGSLGEDGYFEETSPIMPSSPYSASKAGADLMVRAYFETFGLPVNITRCSNNYGPYQFPEKLIPFFVTNALGNRELPLYGDGLNIRDWLYVEDHCSAVDLVMREGRSGEVYNIGGNNEKTNREITHAILNYLQKPLSLIKYVKDRPGHDRRYAIDASKMKRELGWSPQYTFEDAIVSTIHWYTENREWLQNINSGEYMKCYDKMYKR